MSLAPDTLTSKQVEVSGTIDDAIEYCYQQGWTDGLPVIPPTGEKVLRFLDAAGRHPSDVIGVEPVRGRVISAEKVAIAAVMAGCRPEYTPVIMAAMECMPVREWVKLTVFSSLTFRSVIVTVWLPVSPITGVVR